MKRKEKRRHAVKTAVLVTNKVAVLYVRYHIVAYIIII